MASLVNSCSAWVAFTGTFSQHRKEKKLAAVYGPWKSAATAFAGRVPRDIRELERAPVLSAMSHQTILWQSSSTKRNASCTGQLGVRASTVQRSINAVIVDPECKQLLDEVKGRLAQAHGEFPVGKNGRDDDDLLLWFLKDRKFDVDAAVSKIARALAWRLEFGVDGLNDDSITSVADTGKAYLHTSPDIKGRPVIVVVAAKHYPSENKLDESEKLCVFLIEQALSQLSPGEEKILGIFDLRGFTSKNADWKFVKFLVNLFFEYYPKRLGEVLFVDAPYIFQPGWNMLKPILKFYANLVRFCSASEVGKEYFTSETIPKDFRSE